jgi:hypothetical protein
MDNEQIHKIISQLLEDLPPASVSSEDINLLAPAKGVVPAAMLEASGDLLRAHGIIVDRLGDYAVVATGKAYASFLHNLQRSKCSRETSRRLAFG